MKNGEERRRGSPVQDGRRKKGKKGWKIPFQLVKGNRTFKSGGTQRFEPKKNKWKFKPLKAEETKFVPLKSNFP